MAHHETIDIETDKEDIKASEDNMDFDKEVNKIKRLVNKLLENCNTHNTHKFLDMTYDEKVDKIKELVDNLLNDYNKGNIDDEKFQELKSELFELIKSSYKDDEKNLLKNGHSQLDNGKLIRKLFDHCVIKCIKEEKSEFMIVVAVLLPDLINKSYRRTVTNLIMQLSYVKVPSKWCKRNSIQFNSILENLWGYKFPEIESPLFKFPEFGKFVHDSISPKLLEIIPQHTATLCYIPLPGLCTYPKCSDVLNILFPHRLSSFARIVISNSSDILDTSHASFRIYESATVKAIIKFKWHAFARWRFYAIFFIHFIHFIFFSVAVHKTNKTTVGRSLMITSLILEVIFIIQIIRYTIISVSTGIYSIGAVFIYRCSALTLSIITGSLFLHDDTPKTYSVYIQSVSVFLLWIGFIGLLSVFKHIGIFIIVIKCIFREILWPFCLLVIVLLAVAHAAGVYLDPQVTGVDQALKYNDNEIPVEFYRSFIDTWAIFLNDYSFLDPWKDNYFVNISKIIFSLFTSVIILNILIALVNNVYAEVLKRAHAEWTIARAKFIVFIELLFMFPCERQNDNYFPSTITYEAFTEHVDKWPEKLKENDIPTPWEEDDNTDQIIGEMVKKMIDELDLIE